MASAKKPAKKAQSKPKAPARKNPCGEGRRRMAVRGADGRKKRVCAVASRAGMAKMIAAEMPELKAAQVRRVLESVATLAESEVKKGHPFVLPGVARIRIAYRKALPRRKGRNPATGEEIMLKARKAGQVVRARPVKALKDAL